MMMISLLQQMLLLLTVVPTTEMQPDKPANFIDEMKVFLNRNWVEFDVTPQSGLFCIQKSDNASFVNTTVTTLTNYVVCNA